MVEMPPEDRYNKELLANTHPGDWVNPEPAPRYNMVVIGAGTAGLVSAAGAAGLGAKVALIEKYLLGGDCLNFGCVPSKCLIRSSRAAADVKNAGGFGIKVPVGVDVDFPSVMERMRRLRACISRHDSARRFRDLGIDVFIGEGMFSGPDSIEVDGKVLRFSKAVIATGARAADPRIDGLEKAGYLTNETVFSLTERPRRIAVIGGGPIGCELAQAFRRLGSEVYLFHRHPQILNREDPAAAVILQDVFVSEGVNLLLESKIRKVSGNSKEKKITYKIGGREESLTIDEILAGVGRTPNVENLNLEVAGVEYTLKGVSVNSRLQTTNKNIYAAGDICMQYKFTHAADAAARLVIQNALFAGRKKLSALTIPWCTYTDPEIAHVGLNEKDAAIHGIHIDTFIRNLNEVDRAVADGEEEGFAKVFVKKGTDEILGATVVARHAGDMISEITLAMVGGLGLKTLGLVIHPYPTQSEVIKQTADLYTRSRLTPAVKKLFEKWLSWRR